MDPILDKTGTMEVWDSLLSSNPSYLDNKEYKVTITDTRCGEDYMFKIKTSTSDDAIVLAYKKLKKDKKISQELLSNFKVTKCVIHDEENGSCGLLV